MFLVGLALYMCRAQKTSLASQVIACYSLIITDSYCIHSSVGNMVTLRLNVYFRETEIYACAKTRPNTSCTISLNNHFYQLLL
jgi:hypothetical protein